jgi:TRAP transporter 4TM/12TM fusion protein
MTDASLPRAVQVALAALAVLWGLFHLWYSTLDTITESWRNAVHLGGALAFVFAGAAASRSGPARAAMLALAALSLLLPAYVVGFEEALFQRGDVMSRADLWMAAAGLVLVLGAATLAGGWILTIMGGALVLYALSFGSMLPGAWGFRGVSWETLGYRLLWGGEGYLGFLTSISATYVYLFILFGSALLAAGAGDFLVRASLRVGSRLPGGPAQAAVIGSAMMGSVTGTSIGNVMATGSVTIPMMKRAGYRPTFAAGVEASASNIGQIAPPVMGAGAFILAAWTQTSYGTVVAISILPAILYFWSVFLGVALIVRHEGLTFDIEAPDVKWRDGLPFAAGVGTLIGGLVIGYTPIYAVCVAILATIASSWATASHRIGPARLVALFLDAARTAAVTALMLAAANVVVGVLTMTGKAITLASGLTAAAQGEPYHMILVVIGISLVLGMGLPITASYVIVAVVAASGFQELGYSLLAIHLMIFWYSQDSTVTPPIALSAFAAAGIAGCRPFPASLEAWRLSKGLYVIPVLFLSGDILFENGAPAAALAFGLGALGVLAIGVALARHAVAGPVPTPLALPLGLAGVACFALERDIALAGAALAAILLIACEVLARRGAEARA